METESNKYGQEFKIAVCIQYTSKVNNSKDSNEYDDLGQYIDYTEVEVLVSNIFNSKRYNLMESLSNDIGSAIRSTYNNNFVKIWSVNVEIRKNNPDKMKVEHVKVGCKITVDE